MKDLEFSLYYSVGKDCSLEFFDQLEISLPNSLSGDESEKAFNLIELGSSSRSKVHFKT